MKVNNMAEMREALVAMVKAETDGSMKREDLCGRCLSKIFDECKHDGSCWVDKVMSALSKPPRNCDVGSASERYKRFLRYCKKNTGGCDRADRHSNPCAYCFSQWEQMPYEAAKEGARK